MTIKENNQKLGIIALSELKGIGAVFIKKVLSTNLFESSNIFQEIKKITKTNKKQFDDEFIYQAIENAKKIILKCKEEDITILELTNDKYPILLKEIKDSPAVLYCKGNIELLNHNKIVCIIGTRDPNKNGIKISERVSSYYSNSNWMICNGLAEGVDNYSIKHSNLIYNKVIGVLAGGLNYKTKNTLLKKTAHNAENVIKNGGVIVSETPPDTKEDSFRVIKSCRIQAGLSHGVILIQSSLEGGSRFTIKSFCETPRPIAIINPIKSDFDLPTYNANKEIIQKSKKGLSHFVALKEDKIQTSKIFILKSKENYKEFESLMDDSKEKTLRNNNVEQGMLDMFISHP